MRLLQHSAKPIICLSVGWRANLSSCAGNLKTVTVIIDKISGSYSQTILYDRTRGYDMTTKPHWMPQFAGKNVGFFYWFRSLRWNQHVIHLFDITIIFD